MSRGLGFVLFLPFLIRSSSPDSADAVSLRQGTPSRALLDSNAWRVTLETVDSPTLSLKLLSSSSLGTLEGSERPTFNISYWVSNWAGWPSLRLRIEADSAFSVTAEELVEGNGTIAFSPSVRRPGAHLFQFAITNNAGTPSNTLALDYTVAGAYPRLEFVVPPSHTFFSGQNASVLSNIVLAFTNANPVGPQTLYSRFDAEPWHEERVIQPGNVSIPSIAIVDDLRPHRRSPGTHLLSFYVDNGTTSSNIITVPYEIGVPDALPSLTLLSPDAVKFPSSGPTEDPTIRFRVADPVWKQNRTLYWYLGGDTAKVGKYEGLADEAVYVLTITHADLSKATNVSLFINASDGGAGFRLSNTITVAYTFQPPKEVLAPLLGIGLPAVAIVVLVFAPVFLEKFRARKSGGLLDGPSVLASSS